MNRWAPEPLASHSWALAPLDLEAPEISSIAVPSPLLQIMYSPSGTLCTGFT